MGNAVTGAGHIVDGVGSLIGGEMTAQGAEEAGAFKAAQLERAATESRAASQRDAFEQKRKARFALSTLRARAAAGGGGIDSDAIKIGGDIAARGEYMALAELYTGENRARGLEDEAMATRYTAKQQAKAARVGSYFKAGSSILKGIGTALSPDKGTGATLLVSG